MSLLVCREHAQVTFYSSPRQKFLAVSRHFQEAVPQAVNKLGQARVLIASAKGRRLPSYEDQPRRNGRALPEHSHRLWCPARPF